MLTSNAILAWLHIGDLHIADGAGQSLADLNRIVALADDVPDPFALVRDAVAPFLGPNCNGQKW